MAGNTLGCPHKRTGDWICGVLVREVNYATTLRDKEDAAMAIVTTRWFIESMVKEWEHLNGIGTGQPCVKESANLQPLTQQGQNAQSSASAIA
jgi:hypothetical protein